jgi:hypothetical protein
LVIVFATRVTHALQCIPSIFKFNVCIPISLDTLLGYLTDSIIPPIGIDARNFRIFLK